MVRRDSTPGIYGIACFALVTVLGGCTEPQYSPPDGDLSGTWFGVRREGTATVLWQTWKSIGGDIEISFVTCRRGELLQTEHQVGTWDFVDGIYQTRIHQWFIGDEEHVPDGGAEAGFHEYRVLELDDSHIVYRHRTTRTIYEMTRIDENFALGCDKVPRHSPRARGGGTGAPDARIERRPGHSASAAEDGAAEAPP